MSRATRGKTRSNLLDAGLTLFSERGFDGVSVKDLEEAVGLKPGTGSFYRHFKNKEELLEALIEREFDRVKQERTLLKEALKLSGESTENQLKNELQLNLAGMEHKRELINLLGREYGNFPELMSEIQQVMIVESREAEIEKFRGRIEAGEIANLDAQQLLNVIQSAIVGHHLIKTFFGTPPKGVTDDSFIDTLSRLLLTDKN